MIEGIQLLRNDLDTIRCYASLFRSDADLVSELIDLRAFRNAHPLPSKPYQHDALPRSALIRHMEAQVLFGDYCERESRRLTEKLRRMEAGQMTPEFAGQDDAERARNDAIGRRAVAMEAALSPSPQTQEVDRG